MLPNIVDAEDIYDSQKKNICFILSEGFEDRAMSWIRRQPISQDLFSEVLICKYSPSKRSRYEEVYSEVARRTKNIHTLIFNRYNPTPFEQEFGVNIHNINDYDEIILDISVMSKLLIIIIINSLKNYMKKLRIIYTEPLSWSPCKERFDFEIENRESKNGSKEFIPFITLSSVGIYDIVKTPGLSSIVMQNCPAHLVAFLSFNQQLISGLFRDLSPEQVTLINSCSTRKTETWRKNATERIHQEIIQSMKSCLKLETIQFTDYKGVFEKLVEIYHSTYYSKRMILAPIGCKLHAVSCALIKICCPDIHVEYPIPDSYMFDGYSTPEIFKIHQIEFISFKNDLDEVSIQYNLNM
ncbi:MAG: hypothetical protein IJA20_05135 [Methanocorpusculum sp.]|nr:hypothetical protein [Oscillospiraceae bacterium]MBQ3570046.1 hypothetical protein [Methanocorpusculum sp.]